MIQHDPQKDCTLCPRLAAFRRDNCEKYPDFFNGAVPSFGAADPKLLIVGLAPGLKGANWSGRPFTGDYAGDLLYDCLLKTGLAEGLYARHAGDGLTLADTLITNAVKCVPPANKPTGAEIKQCRPFLVDLIESCTRLKAILVLGRIAHESTLNALGLKVKDYKFGHNTHHTVGFKDRTITLVDSYHCSRYNVNTGRLTPEMFLDALESCKALLA